MLPLDLDAVRLSLHVLAAGVWVGGQLVLATLVPVLRGVSADAPRVAARRFNPLGWTAFGVLLLTGVWNLVAVEPDLGGEYGVTLLVKLLAVAVSGGAAAVHTLAPSPALRGATGAASLLAGVVALVLGVTLRA